MTTVDFRLDEESLAEDLRRSPEKADRGAVEETYFVMPVRLCINGIDLLEQAGRAKRKVFVGATEEDVRRIQLPNEAIVWTPLPLLGFATDVLQVLSKLKPATEQKLYLAGGGHLVLARHDDRITVESSINGKRSSTQFNEALTAFQAFSDKVRQLLMSRVPAIEQHVSWRQWFP